MKKNLSINLFHTLTLRFGGHKFMLWFFFLAIEFFFLFSFNSILSLRNSNLMRWVKKIEKKNTRKIPFFAFLKSTLIPWVRGFQVDDVLQFVLFLCFLSTTVCVRYMLGYQISITKTSSMITQDILCDLWIYYFMVVEHCFALNVFVEAIYVWVGGLVGFNGWSFFYTSFFSYEIRWDHDKNATVMSYEINVKMYNFETMKKIGIMFL